MAAAVVGAPAASAASNDVKAKVSAKAVSKKKFDRKLRKVNRSLKALGKLLDGAAEQLNANSNKSVTIFAILQGEVSPALTKLGEAATALKAGLEQAGAGLTQLKGAVTDLASSQEYGVVRIFAGSTALPLSVTSGDIPDDGNTAGAVGVLPVVTGSNLQAGQLPPGTPLNVRAAIRSGENGDGDATGDPAGQVGGLLTLRCAAIDGSCDLNPLPGDENVVAVPTGAVVCSVGPAPVQAFDLPDGSTVNQPLKVIQEAAGRTDQTRPNASDTNVVSGGPATGTGNSETGACSLGDAGDTYELSVQVQFVDLPTSLKPDIND